MNADAAREKLAAGLMDARLIRWREPELAREFADALLPVVREIAAEELRGAYIEDSTTVAKLSPVERLTCRIVKVEDLLVRVDALTGRTS